MRKFVRESKFRHVYGQPSPKDQVFDGISASNSRLDGNICAVNRKFIAVVLVSSGGGVFTILDRNKPGRYERVFKCIQHTSEVIDVCFDPFNPNRIASGAEDGSFVVWWIPDGGLDSDLSEFQCILRGSQRRAVMALWHTSASDILICVNVDGFHIFNVSTAECIRTFDTSQYTEQLYNLSLNYDSTACIVAGKDKKVRVFDLMNGEMKKEFVVHEGSKPIRVAWLHKTGTGQLVATTGATKMSERQVCVWNLEDPATPVASETLDSSSPVLNIYYDEDTNLIALFSKGEVSIRFFELEPNGAIFLVSVYQTQEPQRAVSFGNKLSCNFMAGEIMHSVRVLAKYIEQVAITVPRRSDQFQEDLFPDTYSESPAMTADDFIAGKVSQPNLISLKTYVFPDGSTPCANKSSGLQSSASVSVRPALASKVGTSYNRMSSSPLATTSVADLLTEISELKTLVQLHASKIEELEKKLA